MVAISRLWRGQNWRCQTQRDYRNKNPTPHSIIPLTDDVAPKYPNPRNISPTPRHDHFIPKLGIESHLTLLGAASLQRAKEQFPDVHPSIISDNGPEFIAQ